MKYRYALAGWLLSYPGTAGPPAYIDLPAAETQQLVRLQTRVNGTGDGNLRCVVTNLSGRELRVRVAPGLHFAAADDPVQDMLTYQQQLLTLAPRATHTLRLRALCMEQHDRGPQASPYSLRGPAGRGLQPLADSLYKYPDLATLYGQYFVWAVTDQASLSQDIDVAPEQVRGATNVLRYLATLTGRPTGKALPRANARPSVRPFMRNVSLAYQCATPEVLTLKVFDAAGHERFTIVKDKKVPAGVVQYSFGLNALLRRDEPAAFVVRLLGTGGKVLREVPVTETSSQQEEQPTQQKVTFDFSLDQGVQNAFVRVRLPDGTLVQELQKARVLPAGKHRYSWLLHHLYPAGTAFVLRLEAADGKVLREQAVPAP